MRLSRSFLSLLLFAALITPLTMTAQDSSSSSAQVSVVPHVVKYSGSLPDAPAAASVVEVRFAMYPAQTGGDALWTETQQVALDPQSRYSVLLGATVPDGLPHDLFSTGQPRWLGVTLAGQEESPRTLLAASAYALKASDAETLGGHPISDFTLKNVKPNALTDVTTIAGNNGVLVNNVANSSGTGPTVTLSLDGSYLETLGNNLYAQKTQVVSALTGTEGVIVTHSGTAYNAALDGAFLQTLANTCCAQLTTNNTFHGTQTLAPLGTATTAAGFNSNALEFKGSVYSSTAAAAETVNFQWQVEPSGNDSTSASGSLNLLASTGTAAPAETGLKIGLLGKLSFASGQTFPGVPTDSGNNTFTGNQTITGNETLSGTDTISGSAAGNTAGTLGQLTVTDSATSSANAVAISANSSYIGVFANGNATSGIGVAGTGLIGVDGMGSPADSTATGPGVGVGVGGIGGIGVFGSTSYTGTSEAAVGVEGVIGVTSPSGIGYGVFGEDSSSVGYVGVAGASASGYGVSGSSTGSQGVYGTTAATGGPAGIYGNSSATTIGGDNFPGIGISGNASGPSSWGVYGSSTGSAGVGIYGNGGGSGASIGVYGQGPTGVYGISGSGNGVDGYSTASGSSGVFGSASSGNGVYGKTSSATGYGTFGGNTSTSGSGDGVHGSVDSTFAYGVHGVSVSNSAVGSGNFKGIFGSAIWADTGQAYVGEGTLGAFLATADNNDAAFFENNSSDFATIYAMNEDSGGTTGLFSPVFSAAGKNGACGMNSVGDVTCSGRLKTAVPTGGGAKQVEVYSVQSPENWFEDFGSASLQNGHVTVAIDPQFAAIVNTGVEFHVFLTPQGECEGLYVANKTAGGFEVRELHHGGSNVEFDYRVVAKRSGHENERLVDASAEMNGITARRDELARHRAGGNVGKPEPEPVVKEITPPVTPSSGPKLPRNTPRIVVPAQRATQPGTVLLRQSASALTKQN